MNNTSSPQSTYVFLPVSNTVKLSILCPTVFAGVYGLIANSLILYFMHKKSTSNRLQNAFRRSLTDRFIQSLAFSDVLCSILSLPVYSVEFYVDFIKTDLSCKITRYVSFFCPIVTIVNYFVIGIERYLGVYHPLRLPSQRVCKRLVVAAWCVGAAVVFIVLPSYNLVRYDIDSHTYTMVCKYDNSAKLTNIQLRICKILLGRYLNRTQETITNALLEPDRL